MIAPPSCVSCVAFTLALLAYPEVLSQSDHTLMCDLRLFEHVSPFPLLVLGATVVMCSTSSCAMSLIIRVCPYFYLKQVVTLFHALICHRISALL